MLSYREALQSIFERANFERQDRPPYAERFWRLDRVRELLHCLGDPHMDYPSVHIAGTKGKGSTTAMVDSVLRAAGYHTGMYTSPHLHTFRERIRVDGQPISEANLADLVTRLKPYLAERPEATVFEIITALAMWHYSEVAVDYGVFEVGLGGRLDATNVLAPQVSVITSVSMDHMKVLGDTLSSIASEKAGIIKAETPVVSAPQRPEALTVIEQTCAERGSELTLVGRDWHWECKTSDLTGQRFDLWRGQDRAGSDYLDLFIPLMGEHQVENACTAIAALELLRTRGCKIQPQHVRSGLQAVQWRGRMEVLNERPLVIADGAHNADSVQRLVAACQHYLSYRRVVLIFGVGSTHTPEVLLRTLLPFADEVILTQAQHPKATPPEELQAVALQLGYQSRAAATVDQALDLALGLAAEDDLILGTGSLFVVAALRQAWAQRAGWPELPADPPGSY